MRYIVLDFRRVTGLDSSAVLSFVKGKQLAEAHDITLVLTHISERMQHQFELGGLSEDDERVRIFPDLDHGLGWCENRLLEIERTTMVLMPTTLRGQLADSGFDTWMKHDGTVIGIFIVRNEVRWSFSGFSTKR